MNPFYKLNETLANIGKEQDKIAESVAKAAAKSPVQQTLEQALRTDLKSLMESQVNEVSKATKDSYAKKAKTELDIYNRNKNNPGASVKDKEMAAKSAAKREKGLAKVKEDGTGGGMTFQGSGSLEEKSEMRWSKDKDGKLVNHPEKVDEKTDKWIQKATKPSTKGDLHKALHVPQGEKIPKGKIEKASHSKNAHLRHMAQFAKNVAHEGEEMDLDEVGAGGIHGRMPDPMTKKDQQKKMNPPRSLEEKDDSDEDIMDYLNRKLAPHDKEQAKEDAMARPYNGTGKADAYAGLEFEGNAFTGKLAHTAKGGKFELDGKEYKDTSSLEETVSRKHFQQVADLLKNIPDPEKRKELALHHASIFKQQNPRFDIRRFAQAADVDLEECAMWEELKGGQKKLDRNHNGKLDANDFAMLRAGNKMTDEDFEDELKVGQTRTTHKGGTVLKTPTGLRHTAGPKNYGGFDPSDIDTDTDEKPAKEKKSVVTRGRGRPATGRAPARLTKGAYKNKRTEVEEKKEPVKKDDKAERAGKKVTKDIEYDEKKKDNIHGKKRGSEDAKAERAGKRVAKDIEYDEKKKEKKVEETTTSGSVATSGATHPAASAMGVGKGIYDSINREVEKLIAETVDVQMARHDINGAEQEGEVIIRATGEEADIVKDLLRNAGLINYDNTLATQHGHDEVCQECGHSPCACGDSEAEVMGLPGEVEIEIDEADAPVTMNEPDWPTNQEESDDALQYSGGLNGPKSTGQSTIPVLASQTKRQMSDSEPFQVAEDVDSFLNLYQAFKTK